MVDQGAEAGAAGQASGRPRRGGVRRRWGEARRQAPAAVGRQWLGRRMGEEAGRGRDDVAANSWVPPPHGRHVSETAGQNRPMVKCERF